MNSDWVLLRTHRTIKLSTAAAAAHSRLLNALVTKECHVSLSLRRLMQFKTLGVEERVFRRCGEWYNLLKSLEPWTPASLGTSINRGDFPYTRSGWRKSSRLRWSRSSSRTSRLRPPSPTSSAWTSTRPTGCLRERARLVVEISEVRAE